MRSHRSTSMVLLWTSALAACCASAMACGMCIHIEFHAAYPPVIFWDLTGIIWFLILAIHRSITRQKGLTRFPGIFITLGLLFLAFLIHTTYIGPVATLPFLPWAALQNLALARRLQASVSPAHRWFLHAIGALALLVILMTTIHEAVWPTFRAPADYIIKARYSSKADQAYRELKATEPDSIPEYRRILREANHRELVHIARRLQDIGDPGIDIPLIQEAIRRNRDAEVTPNPSWLERLETIVEEMSHVPPEAHQPEL